MKKAFSIGLTIFAVLASVATAQTPEDSVRMAQMMEAQQLAVPGPEHEMLKKLAGKWNMEMSFWMAPGQNPMVINSTSDHKMILGDRFLEMYSVSEAMGMTTESKSFMGFDRRTKQFTSVGFDTFGTYYVTSAGTYDEATKTITMHGEDFDPVFGSKQIYDNIIKIVDDNKYILSLIFYNPEITQGAESFKMVEIVYTRIP